MYDDPRCDLTRLHDATRADLEELAKLLPAPRRFSAALMLELMLDRDRERKSWNLPDKPGLPSRQALMRLYKTWRDQGVFEVLADVFHGECELWRARFELLRDSHRAYRAPFVELASPSDETFEELVRQVCEAVRPRYHAASLQATMRYARGLCSGDVISNNVARRRLNVCVSSGWLPSIMCFAGLTELSGDPRTDVVGDLAWLEGRLDRSRTFDERLPSLEREQASASVREGLELAWPGEGPAAPFPRSFGEGACRAPYTDVDRCGLGRGELRAAPRASLVALRTGRVAQDRGLLERGARCRDAARVVPRSLWST